MTTAEVLLPVMKFDRFRIGNVLIAAMFAAVVFDMGGQVGVRDIVLVAGAVFLVLSRRIVVHREMSWMFALFVVYPTFLLLAGILSGADLSVAVSQYRSTVLSFILMVILSDSSYRFLAKSLHYSIGCTALVAIVIAVSLALGMDIFVGLISRFHEGSAGYFGMRNVGEDAIPNIYFKSTLFFVPAAFYFLFRGSHFLYLVCFLGLVAAVSKTGIILVLGGSILYYVFSDEKLSLKLMIGAILAAVVLFLYQSPMMRLFFEIQEGRSATVDARIGHLSSILQLFSDHPIKAIFGFGLGTEFYSEGFGEYVWNIELDHLNCIRKYGLIWSGFFFGTILLTSVRSIKSPLKEVRALGVCLLLAFVVAGTNPVLISPVFSLFLFVPMLANIQSNA